MTRSPDAPRPTPAGFTLGRQAFARISAVEGIHLTAEMEARFAEFDDQGLSANQRRRAISEAMPKN